MATRRWSCDRDLATRKETGQAGKGKGVNENAVVGLVSGNVVFRYLTRFIDSYEDNGPDEPSVGLIRSAVVKFTTNDNANSDVSTDAGSKVVGHRNTGAFNPSDNDTFNEDDYAAPKVDGAVASKPATISGANGGHWEVDVTDFVRHWAPPKVNVMTSGSAAPLPGLGGDGVHANHGIRWKTPDETKAVQHFAVRGQHGAWDVEDRPHIIVTYDPRNQPPSATWDTPTSGSSTGTHYTGSYSDPEGQAIEKAQVRVYKEGVTNDDNTSWGPETAEAEEHAWPDGRYDVEPPAPGVLKKKNDAGETIQYEGQARVYAGKEWSAWTKKADGRFTITSTPPSIALIGLGSRPSLATTRFRTVKPWAVDGNAGGLTSYVAQLVGKTTDGSVAWLNPIWDSGPRPVTIPQNAETQLDFAYTGPNLPAGNYSWRVRVFDGLNEVSDWAYDHTLVLTAAYVPTDVQDETIAYARPKVQTRIVMREVNTADGARRRPGKVTAVIEDPFNLGISANATTPGQVYFTLPSQHPQIAVIEPFAAHYRVEQYRGSEWRAISEGLITDFDASDNDTIFYGLDYLGVLSLTIEAQPQPAELPEAKWPKGAKYFKNTISYVIKDQLTRATGDYGNPDQRVTQRDQALLGFFDIPVGGVDAMDNEVTIHSAFVQRLDFIRGLIDSYKGGGLGRRPRITARQNPFTGDYEFIVRSNAGKDRPNIRLEYGSLVQGYRVMALGDFAVHVYGVGRKRNELKPMFEDIVAPGGGVLKDWGEIAKATIWQDLADNADLIRRTRQMVNETSRVGKRVALGLRVNALLPEDGWSICDSVKVSIKDGTVDTSRYGSDEWWTVWGWEYRLHPDGHDEMTLVLKPKEIAETAEPDLIPSRPIHRQPEWQIGVGPPTEFITLDSGRFLDTGLKLNDKGYV